MTRIHNFSQDFGGGIFRNGRVWVCHAKMLSRKATKLVVMKCQPPLANSSLARERSWWVWSDLVQGLTGAASDSKAMIPSVATIPNPKPQMWRLGQRLALRP